LPSKEKIWLNDSTDATALAQKVAEQIAFSASGRSDLEALIIVSDGKVG